MPLEAESRICAGVRCGAICFMMERSACEGVTQRMISASAIASAIEGVISTPAGRIIAGEVAGVFAGLGELAGVLG